MAITTYIGPIESEGEAVEFRVEDGSGDTAGMIEVAVYTYEDGNELVLTYMSRDHAAELRDALTARLNG